MSLKNWLILFINLSLLSGCACMGVRNTEHGPDVVVWIVDAVNEGAWGSSRHENDKGEFKLCSEMDNYVCFDPKDVPPFLRR